MKQSNSKAIEQEVFEDALMEYSNEQINVHDEWAKNWNNAYKFFHSKGNVDTRAKLKKIWYDGFYEIFHKVDILFLKKKNEALSTQAREILIEVQNKIKFHHNFQQRDYWIINVIQEMIKELRG